LANGPKPLSFWVASDIHYKPYSDLPPVNEKQSLPGDPLFSHTNDKSMLTYEADAIIDEFLKRFEASDSNILLIPGDLSEEGHWTEHLGLARILNEFKQRTGKRIFVIPGNHDIRTSASQGRLDLEDFLEIYKDLGPDEALVKHDTSASYTVDLDAEYRLLAIDACKYRNDSSQMTPELLAWIEDQVLAAKADGKKIIGMVHHNVLPHFGIQDIMGSAMNIENARENASKFADWGIKYFITGHEHANDISMAVSAKGNRIYDIETGCLLTYPNAYRELKFTNEAVEVKTGYIDKIDLSLLPQGFNEAQLRMMAEDFPAYSYGYFKAGLMSVAYDVPNFSKRLASSLEVGPDSPFYGSIEGVMQALADALNMPLYDKGTPAIDSVEEIVAAGGDALPKSDYRNILEVAGAIYAVHYAGDENLSHSSAEVEILKKGLASLLINVFTNLPVSATLGFIRHLGLDTPDLPDFVYDLAYTGSAKVIFAKTVSSRIMEELIKPLLNSFISDSYTPADLNVVLEPYGENWKLPGRTVPITDTDYAMNIIFKSFELVVNCAKTVIAA
ncbi:MAG TPA: metallophosphoesterase, partial [Clostridiales bacterium]|nr:metallophosphoesterase [Clostridiales bacterium]